MTRLPAALSSASRLRRSLVVLAALALPFMAASSQRRRGGEPEQMPNVPYDGRFTFARVKYDMGMGGGSFGRVDVKWAHDYPRGERHFTKIVSELSSTRVRTDASNILTFDDPEIFRYPVTYMAEPGFWRPSDSEVLNMQKYLAKGGFIIFDDFMGPHWMNFETQMRKVLPKARPVALTTAHPIFDSFYRIENLEYEHPYGRGLKAIFYGYFEDNDPTKRLVAIANFNNDLSEMWEFSDEGLFPLEQSNEAYKLGVNYIIYALTR